MFCVGLDPEVGTHVANRCVAQLGKNECPRDDGLIWGERTSTRSLDNVIDNGIESVWEVDAGVGGISGGSGPIDSDGRGGSGGEDADGNAYNLSPEVMLVFRVRKKSKTPHFTAMGMRNS